MDPPRGRSRPHLQCSPGFEKKGLIRHIGLSNVTATQIAEARRITPIVCVQNMYNLVQRSDDALIDDLAWHEIAYVPFFPLGGFSPLQSAALSDIATQLEVTPMQVALAWLFQRSPNILLIPGTSSLKHLRENLKASTLELTSELFSGSTQSVEPTTTNDQRSHL